MVITGKNSVHRIMINTTLSFKKEIYYSDGIDFCAESGIFDNEGIGIRKISAPLPALPDNTFTVYVIAENETDAYTRSIERLGLSNGFKPVLLVVSANPGEALYTNPFVEDVIKPPLTRNYLLYRIRHCFSRLQLQYEKEFVSRELRAKSSELKELSDISSLLMMEKDLGKLLNQILLKSREMTQSDAGSVFLVEEHEEGRQLRFKWTQNDSMDLPWQEFTFPLSSSSIAGYVALTGRMLTIDDTYEISPAMEYGFNRSFDEKTGYRTKSMLVAPLRNHKDEIIGVLQLINRKRNWESQLTTHEIVDEQVIPFTGQCEDTIQAFGGMAAISIENNLLYRSIENLFEGFVKAAVTAIESRDPTTSGHSNRVAILTTTLAEHVDRTGGGRFRDTKFSYEQMKEIRYASLLHDFGKVGVREEVLLKAKKLYPYHLQQALDRFKYIRRSMQYDKALKKIEHLLKNGGENAQEILAALDEELREQVGELDEFVRAVIEANEPTILEQDTLEKIRPMKGTLFRDPEGGELPYITDEEFLVLSIKKGSLAEKERREIESHVTHTFNFLKLVPWTKDLTSIPMIAYAHHEKLNSEGYPNKLNRYQIPIQSKMMTIADIYDALTAADRPYKKAASTERALQILNFEVKDDHVDPDLLDIFIEGKVFDSVKQQPD